MKKNQLAALILISIATLSGCSKPEATATEPANKSQTVEKSPGGDIYAMAYKLCGKTCDKANVSVITTWGRPTEVGVVYFDGIVSNINTKLIGSMHQYAREKVYFVVKSKGSLPGQEEPMGTERFVPTESYISYLAKSRGVSEKEKPLFGHIEILQIKKIDRTPGDNPRLVAMSLLKERLTFPFMVTPDQIGGYMWATKDKPDVVPQQVDRITWQEGGAAQIIPVRAW